MDYSAEQINKAFDKLPKITSRAIFGINIDEIKAEIVKKYNIHLDLATILSNYITFVLIGLMKTEDFGPTIKKELNLSEEASEKITEDVNDMIFLKVRNRMKEFQKKEEINKELMEININIKVPVPIPPYKKEKESEIKTNSIGIDSIKEKMSAPSKSENVISDYSIPKMSSGEITEEGNKKEDIYREEI